MTARDEISEVVVVVFFLNSSSSSCSSSGEDKTFRTLLLDTFVLVKSDSSPLRDGAKPIYITISQKLWRDSDQTWWARWVFGKDELIRFW